MLLDVTPMSRPLPIASQAVSRRLLWVAAHVEIVDALFIGARAPGMASAMMMPPGNAHRCDTDVTVQPSFRKRDRGFDLRANTGIRRRLER